MKEHEYIRACYKEGELYAHLIPRNQMIIKNQIMEAEKKTPKLGEFQYLGNKPVLNRVLLRMLSSRKQQRKKYHGNHKKKKKCKGYF